MAHRWIAFPQEAPSTPMPRAAAASSYSARNGVVSRVPRGSRNAQAFGTDRNTDLTDDTPATTNPNAPGQPPEPTTETDSSNRMRNLNYELKQLCRRNRDGSFATQRDRERVLDLVASQLPRDGLPTLHGRSKPQAKARRGPGERWQSEGLAVGTIRTG